MGLIEDFVARYVKEYDFYHQAGVLVAQELEANLRASGVRCIVTSRAKSVSRLEDKCRQRAKKKKYESIDDIYRDIVDLAGVRVALYFPAEREQVDKVVNRLFNLLEEKKEFPDPNAKSGAKRFSGYSAVHYRVQLREHELSETDRRYAEARVEIQVASVLMHAWSEVEHDLDYKPLEGSLSESEYAILDQLNGLVIAGEVALEMLQRAGESRVAEGERQFVNHYELAVHLLSHMDALTGQPVSDSELGRVDLLFGLLDRLDFGTPRQLAPYLQVLHENLELRPAAEQIVDALLAEDGNRYGIYQSVRAAMNQQDLDNADIHRSVGAFVSAWIDLEKLLLPLVSIKGNPRRILGARELESIDLLDDDLRELINFLRRVRNNLVHGIEIPDARDLANATRLIGDLIAEINRRRSTREGH